MMVLPMAAGDSLVTSESPTGDRQSSPVVCSRMPMSSHSMPTMFEAVASRIVRITAPRKASDASSRVGGRLVASCWLTGTPAWIEKPKLPVRKLPTVVK